MKSSRLKSDPDKTRAWQQRSRRPLDPGKRKTKAKIPPSVREAVKRRSGGKCVRPGCGRKAVHLHHVLDEQGWPGLAKIEANLIGLCVQCHMDHTFAPDGRLPFEALPDCALALAAKTGPKALVHLERHYAKPAESDISTLD